MASPVRRCSSCKEWIYQNCHGEEIQHRCHGRVPQDLLESLNEALAAKEKQECLKCNGGPQYADLECTPSEVWKPHRCCAGRSIHYCAPFFHHNCGCKCHTAVSRSQLRRLETQLSAKQDQPDIPKAPLPQGKCLCGFTYAAHVDGYCPDAKPFLSERFRAKED